MQIRNWIISKRIERRMLSLLFCLALLSMFTGAVAHAAGQPVSLTAKELSNPAHDITTAGTVQQLTPAGARSGLQLVVDGAEGSFTASLGSSLDHEVEQSLSQGASVQ